VAFCDVPDSDILAARYPTADTITFRAGVELWSLQLGIYLLALLKRFNLIDNLPNYAATLKSLSDPLTSILKLGTDQGGLNVKLTGKDQQDENKEVTYSIYAGSCHGPCIFIFFCVYLLKRYSCNSCCIANRKASKRAITIWRFSCRWLA
jgi:hypothetical protein